MTSPTKRTIPALAAAALLVTLAACEETAETGAVEGTGDEVIVVPETDDGVATDG
jgi:hypothetical protein